MREKVNVIAFCSTPPQRHPIWICNMDHDLELGLSDHNGWDAYLKRWVESEMTDTRKQVLNEQMVEFKDAVAAALKDEREDDEEEGPGLLTRLFQRLRFARSPPPEKGEDSSGPDNLKALVTGVVREVMREQITVFKEAVFAALEEREDEDDEEETPGLLTRLLRRLKRDEEDDRPTQDIDYSLRTDSTSYSDYPDLPNDIKDITKFTEKVPISLVGGLRSEGLPEFNYISHNIICVKAYVDVSLSQIADEDCCKCSGSCMSCSCSNGYAYDSDGLLRDQFLEGYSYDCPYRSFYCNKRRKMRTFIKECWKKCGCNMYCINRVVQRGIVCKLEVFKTTDGKGWGLRTLEDLEKGSFVCEYVGEILTASEYNSRRQESMGTARHTYFLPLDCVFRSEQRVLFLDATHHGNAARFINHRCADANLVDFPVQVETRSDQYYHVAFFTTRKVNALEELTWDYGLDFEGGEDHSFEAFQCMCGSKHCRDKKQNAWWKQQLI